MLCDSRLPKRRDAGAGGSHVPLTLLPRERILTQPFPRGIGAKRRDPRSERLCPGSNPGRPLAREPQGAECMRLELWPTPASVRGVLCSVASRFEISCCFVIFGATCSVHRTPFVL